MGEDVDVGGGFEVAVAVVEEAAAVVGRRVAYEWCRRWERRKSRQEITYPLMCILRVYSIEFNKQHFFSCMCEACRRVWYDMIMPLNKGYTGVLLEKWQCSSWSSSNVSSSRLEVIKSSPHTSQHIRYLRGFNNIELPFVISQNARHWVNYPKNTYRHD